MKRLLFAAFAVALLPGCRPPIAPITVPARVAPDGPPGVAVQVCWIESKKFGPATGSSLVVRHPAGDVLIDAGNSTNFDQEIQVYDKAERRWRKRLPGLLVPKRPLREVLADAGVDAAKIRWFVPTHAHIDHIGGYLDLPPIPALLDPEEVALVERGRKELTSEVVPAHARGLSPHVTPLPYESRAYEIYDRSADLFGDGTVVVVPLHGHTPGSVGVFINRPDGTRIFHVGDATNERSAIEKRQGRRKSLQRSDTDRAAADAVVAGLHELAKAAPEIAIIPAHERSAYADVFGRPAKACPSPR